MSVSKFEVVTICPVPIMFELKALNENHAYQIAQEVIEELQSVLAYKTNDVIQFSLLIEEVNPAYLKA